MEAPIHTPTFAPVVRPDADWAEIGAEVCGDVELANGPEMEEVPLGTDGELLAVEEAAAAELKVIVAGVYPTKKVMKLPVDEGRLTRFGSPLLSCVYNNTTFQEENQFLAGAPVRIVKFGNANAFIVCAGRKSIQLWNVTVGNMIWSAKLPGEAVAIDFNEDDTRLMLATTANTMSIWEVANGILIDTFHFNDIDEDAQTDFRYQRHPTFAAISPGLNLLAVAFRQRPIAFWDLTDNNLQGQFHKSVSSYPWPLIVALLINPKPEIQLVAVAYHGVTAEASILATSPDGTVLAADHGSSGVISIYDFETLRLLYRLSSYEEDIRMIIFASNNLRFFDIRGDHCNVWQPWVLVRHVDVSDDSIFGLSEEVSNGPQIVSVRTYDDNLMITALVAHHDAETIFCGRENGSVAVYSIHTGQCTEELIGHGHDVAILSLTWHAEDSLLAITDRSSRVVVYVVSKLASGKLFVGTAALDVEMESVIQQVLFSPDGAHILVSTSESDVLWSVAGRSNITRREADPGRNSWSWITHPAEPSQVLLICNGHAYLFKWNDLSSLTTHSGIELTPSSDPSLIIFGSISSSLGQNLCLRFLRPRTSKAAPQFSLWPAQALRPELASARSVVSYPSLAAQMKYIIGVSKSDLIFLDDDGWVCSLKIDAAIKERFYVKHFFIPYGWHSMRANLSMGITEKGAIFMAVRDELAVFHGGLDIEEKTPVGDADVTPVPSMRSMMRRGVSGF